MAYNRGIEICRTGINLRFKKRNNRSEYKPKYFDTMSLSFVQRAVNKKDALRYDVYLDVSIHVFGAAI